MFILKDVEPDRSQVLFSVAIKNLLVFNLPLDVDDVYLLECCARKTNVPIEKNMSINCLKHSR